MAYDNIPQASATYLDGAFRTFVSSAQPAILLLGTARSGRSYQVFKVGSVAEAEREFGADSELMKGVHEVVSAGADNVSVMRICGRSASIVIEDSGGATLTIKTLAVRDDEALDRYALFVDDSGSENRYLVWDLIEEEWVYDSEEVYALDTGVISIEDTGIESFSLGDYLDVTTAISLADLVVGDFTPSATAITKTDGEDGISPSLVERYAALEVAYHNLDFNDADVVIPLNAFHDATNIAVDGSASTGLFFGPHTSGVTQDRLGYVWQYVYQGNVYVYFTDASNFFTASKTAASRNIGSGDLVITAVKAGVGGNAISFQITDNATDSVTVTETATGVTIVVAADITGGVTWDDIETQIEASVEASKWITAAGNTDPALVTSAAVLSGGAGPAFLSHLELTGEEIPSAVATAWTAADTNNSDSQLREVNFSHQLGTFLHRASTTWKAMMGGTSFKAPSSYDRNTVAEWVGNLPDFTQDGAQVIVASSGDNGTGILGNKFVGGRHNYRVGDVDSGDGGLAYGGLIKTKGANLPNGKSEFAYGVLDTDQETDRGGRPVDLGKHLVISGDWIIHRNSFNGGSTYRGPIVTKFFGMLGNLPANIQPIGNNGRLSGVSGLPRIHATQSNDLVAARVLTLRRDPETGIGFVHGRTAAHPDSDYTRISTIRAVNRIVQGVRRVIRPYFGQPFNSQTTIALKDAIDRYLASERVVGMHLGAQCQLVFDRQSRILGKLTCRLRIVPPFSLESVDIETSMAADETEL